MDFEAGIANRTEGDGPGDLRQPGKVHRQVEALRREGGAAVGDGLEPFTHLREMVQTVPQAEIVPVVGSPFHAQEAGELLLLAEQGALEVGPKDVVAVGDRFEDGGELAAQLAGEPYAENLADAVAGPSPPTDFAAPLEDFGNRKVTLEDKVSAVLDRRDGVKAREAQLAAFLL